MMGPTRPRTFLIPNDAETSLFRQGEVDLGLLGNGLAIGNRVDHTGSLRPGPFLARFCKQEAGCHPLHLFHPKSLSWFS